MIKILDKEYWYTLYVRYFCRSIQVCSDDFDQLQICINQLELTYHHIRCKTVFCFITRLRLAIIHNSGEIPKTVVKMHSLVSFIDVKTKRVMQVELVYPKEENIFDYKLSVFSAVGMALFGQSEGAVVVCRTGRKRIKLKIIDVK